MEQSVDQVNELTTYKQNLLSHISLLYDTYKEDTYIHKKLLKYFYDSEKHISHIIKEREHREQRKLELFKNKEDFIINFLDENHYYYIPEYDTYIAYDKTNFSVISEDLIWCKIRVKIYGDRTLVDWKDRVRIEIMSLIKKQLLTKSIPESDTIQQVLTIFNNVICNEKEESKFLLTLIGDIILKKHIDYTFIANPKIHSFLETLERELCLYQRSYVLNAFKYKYYNHSYDNILFVKTRDSIDAEFIWKGIIKENILNIISVSTHYSRRYDNAYNYIMNRCHNNSVKQRICYLTSKTKDSVVEDFLSRYTTTSDTLDLTYKEIMYLWKTFLKSNDLPNIMFYRDFETILQKNLKYDEENKTFTGLTSSKLEYIRYFRNFIDEQCCVNPIHNDNQLMCYEISELQLIFQKWCYDEMKPINITEKQVVSILTHFYEDIKIRNGKYICGITSPLWNKIGDIQEFLKLSNEKSDDVDSVNIVISNDDMYKDYCRYIYNKKSPFIVSKSYFETYFSNL